MQVVLTAAQQGFYASYSLESSGFSHGIPDLLYLRFLREIRVTWKPEFHSVKCDRNNIGTNLL